MKELRPHQIFDRVEEDDRLALICLPRRHSLTSMIERAILASLLKLVKPRTIFEFGTYLGESALILAANSDAKVYSIDLTSDLQSGTQKKFDEFERTNLKRRLTGGVVFKDKQCEDHIETISGDSTSYDFSPFFKRMDFVLIDGGHHIDVVDSDTKRSFKMLSVDQPACILWHDYGNPNYKITGYLNDLSQQHELHHVAETSYVFLIKNVGENLSLVW